MKRALKWLAVVVIGVTLSFTLLIVGFNYEPTSLESVLIGALWGIIAGMEIDR